MQPELWQPPAAVASAPLDGAPFSMGYKLLQKQGEGGNEFERKL